MRSLFPLRRIRQLTVDEQVRPVVHKCLEAAISKADDLSLMGFFKSLLPFDGGRGRLRAVASDSLELSLSEDALEGHGGPGGSWPSFADDLAVA